MLLSKNLYEFDDKTQPIHRRLFRGPNTWPDAKSFPGFKPLIDDLNGRYHRLTHLLGEAIVESLGQDVSAFHEYESSIKSFPGYNL